MMKLWAFVAVATFLVVGTKSDSPTQADRDRWSQECLEELQQNPLSIVDHPPAGPNRYQWCSQECNLRKAGMMEDGRLAEREKVSNYMAGLMISPIRRPKEGRTSLQLAEKCYDEGNAKTEKCEIAGTMMRCIKDGLEDVKASTKK